MRNSLQAVGRVLLLEGVRQLRVQGIESDFVQGIWPLSMHTRSNCEKANL
jgi:hypothetical protein